MDVVNEHGMLIRCTNSPVIVHRKSSSNIKTLLRYCALALLALTPLLGTSHEAMAQITQCNDGVDNDGDGRVDGLFNLGPNALARDFGSGQEIKQFLASVGYPQVAQTGAEVYAGGPIGGGPIPSATRVCNLAGFRTATITEVATFRSCGNNDTAYWNGATFVVVNGCTLNAWVQKLHCQDLIPACSDGKDNDGDGKVDMADTGCVSPLDNSEYIHDPRCITTGNQSEFEQCRNGVDDDGDALIDRADPGCWTNVTNPATYDPNRDNEKAATSQCQDGIDNDGDGAIDLADFSCGGDKRKNTESTPKAQCQDGLDNDADGLIDLKDPGCASPQDNVENDKTTQCQDGVDNDGDGAVDLADFSCGGDKTKNDESTPKSQCQDGLDNDSDGLIDLKDPGCSNSQDNNESDGTSQCQDGIDNDGDGAVDLADFSCGGDKTKNDESTPKSQCQDGLDNDADGLTDMKDPGCSTPQDNNESDGTSQCQDKVDNDGDGQLDLDDPGCSDPSDNDESNPGAAVTIKGECVGSNGDGTYTAYFSYENSGTGAIDIVDNAAAKSVNVFSPAPTKVITAGPTHFETGLKRGVAIVTFSGDSITWTVGATGLARSAVTLSKTSSVCASVEPKAECIDLADNGMLKGVFGYNNPNGFEITIPVGTRNSFSPGEADRGQPNKFFPGTNSGAFSLQFKDPLTWTLADRTTQITTTTAVCPGGCTQVSTVEIDGELDAVATQFAQLTNRAADFLLHNPKLAASERAALIKDGDRAKRKAQEFVKRAQELRLEFPQIIRNCPKNPIGCTTVDRMPTIDALKALYRQQFAAARRIIARAYFNRTGKTNRGDAMVAQAKRLLATGDASLAKLPRFATECG